MSGTRKFRILIADDNELNQKIVRDMLGLRGYELVCVRTGPEAIRSLKDRAFDLVIMDCLMPGMDGFATARAIRNANPADFDPTIPILAVTALSTPSDRDKCFEAGMDEYMSKPFRAETLYSKLDTLLHGPARVGVRSIAYQSRHASAPDIGEILRSMADVVITDARQWQHDLRLHIDNNEFEAIRLLAHRIRGTADIVGFNALSDAASSLENAALAGDLTSAPELAGQVIAELENLVRLVKSRGAK